MIDPKQIRKNLATAIKAQLATAAVFEYPPGKMADRRKATVFLGAVTDVAMQDSSLLGDSEGVYTIEGAGYATSGGATDAQWEVAESNAYNLLAAVVAVLEADETIGGTVGHGRVTNWRLEPTQTEDNVFFALNFTITGQYWP